MITLLVSALLLFGVIATVVHIRHKLDAQDEEFQEWLKSEDWKE